eukprot:TRINITY_DN1630_c2_g2_i1.p1 TRINITY_DN1630_c2_g2~~TRINITY_DN1630_c2_g2_i1.p1  ORF type:complete len:180 (-),score=37.00 TRINITY_DN1630_c2_g2_i1:18-557(-)
MDYEVIQRALDHGLCPVVYGDVAFDDVLGGCIASTESIFCYLTKVLKPNKLLLMGEVEGVYDENKEIIKHIHSENYESISTALGGSRGIDVTGGMASKVKQMMELVQFNPQLEIHIFSGLREGQLRAAVVGQAVCKENPHNDGPVTGTKITYDAPDRTEHRKEKEQRENKESRSSAKQK